jgi:hypothetical protein
MVSRRAARGQRGRQLCQLFTGVALLTAGCSSTAGLGVFAPYRGALSAEEYRTPPANDARYTQPPTYPSHLLKPVYKPKDDDKAAARPAFGGGSPGMMPGQ